MSSLTLVLQSTQLIDLLESKTDWSEITRIFGCSKLECLGEFKLNLLPPLQTSDLTLSSENALIIEAHEAYPNDWAIATIQYNRFTQRSVRLTEEECKLQYYRLMLHYDLNQKGLIEKLKLLRMAQKSLKKPRIKVSKVSKVPKISITQQLDQGLNMKANRNPISVVETIPPILVDNPLIWNSETV